MSRRSFLKLSSAACLGSWLGAHGSLRPARADSPGPGAARGGSLPGLPVPEPPTLGRAILPGLHVHPLPVVNAPDVRYLAAHEVVDILEVVEGEPWLAHNPTWFRLEDGYVYSSWVQPVRDEPQPTWNVVGTGWWGQVSVPWVAARWAPDPDVASMYVFPYGTLFRVVAVRRGADRQFWYRVLDDQHPSWQEWVPSHALRRLPEREFQPIHPEVEEKVVDIDLSRFTITALEGGQPILAAPIATGARFRVQDEIVDFRTPPGRHRVLWKRPSRHMIGGTRGERDYFDLPGVPWCAYFTWSGAAIHGTYWHNDYGVQRSHGCVNVSPEVARFFYRWTLPTAPYEAAHYLTRDQQATPVIVHY